MLLNTDGVFSVSKNQPFESLGMITDALFTDIDNDGSDDLVVVGEWMSPRFFKNDKGQF